MTSERSPTVENEALSERIEAIEQQVAQLSKTVARARVTRLVLFLAALVFIAVSALMFYRLAMRFKSKKNLDLLVAKAKERVNQNSDRYLQQVRQLMQTCAPVLREAFFEQAKKDLPKYTEAIGAERDQFVEDLQTRLGERITARYQESAEQYKTVLQEEFPQINDPELLGRMYTSIEQIMEQLVKKYYSDELRRELLEMYDTWDQFVMAEPPSEGEAPLEDQLIGNLLELVSMKLSGTLQPYEPEEETPESVEVETP